MVMPTIHKEIAIAAPIDRVLARCDNPARVARFAPHVAEVREDRSSAGGIGDRFPVTYAVGGRRPAQAFTYPEYARPHQLTVRFDGEPRGTTRGTTRYPLREPQGATRLTLETTLETAYEVAGGAIEWAVWQLLDRRPHEREADQLLHRIKGTVEEGDLDQADLETPAA
jgi:hypothetical protein